MDFSNSLGSQMLFVPSATFTMGCADPTAPANEQPTTRVTLSRFYLSRYPVTNGEYEKFDPAHKSRRGAWADDRHPVIYVSYGDAMKFCQWLSVRERKRYRLPTEAEWEYAAKADEECRTYPWGDADQPGHAGQFRRRQHDVSVARRAGQRRVRRNFARRFVPGGRESFRRRGPRGQRVRVVPGLLRAVQGRRAHQPARAAAGRPEGVPGGKLEIAFRQPAHDGAGLQPADVREQRRGLPDRVRMRLTAAKGRG